MLVLTLVPQRGPNAVEQRPLDDIRPAIVHPSPGSTFGVVGNVLLFVPFGAALFLRRTRAARAVLLGAGFSICVELVQLVVPGRTSATDDVILNTLGAGCGWAAAAGIASLLARQAQSAP